MKKIIISIICLLLCISVSGCSDNSDNEVEDVITNDAKTLVVYFSPTGNTSKVAKKIKDITNSDIIKIVPEDEYTKEDLDYNDENSRASKEQDDNNIRPKIKNNKEIDIDKYDVIYIGYPIWFGTAPKIIYTLLDEHYFDFKKIVLFCTSGSTDIEESANDIKIYNSNLKVIGSKRFTTNSSKEEIKQWIDSL